MTESWIESFLNHRNKVKKQAPLIHNLTNHVVMNFTANCLLAVGASPVMSEALEETEELTVKSKALVVNIGTLDPSFIQRARLAMTKAQEYQIPVVLDPVGAGATRFRTETALSLLAKHQPTVVRGNASEILALSGENRNTKGVDSLAQPEAALSLAKFLSKQYNCVICVSGATDLIVFQEQVKQVPYGHVMMTQVTGMGCTASALIAAFTGTSSSAFEATYHAMILMGMAGKAAASAASLGTGSFQTAFIDKLYSLADQDMYQILHQHSSPLLSSLKN